MAGEFDGLGPPWHARMVVMHNQDASGRDCLQTRVESARLREVLDHWFSKGYHVDCRNDDSVASLANEHYKAGRI